MTGAGPEVALAGQQPFAEADLIPLSALQHWAYCPRQAMLIHLEQQWADKLAAGFTNSGSPHQAALCKAM